MPPNTSSASILEQVEYRFTQIANPYSETKNACFEECPGTSGSPSARENEDEEPEQLVEDSLRLRVTTRARLTYELYKYSKNAMLIVTLGNPCKCNTDVDELKTTFEKFRFEVNVVRIKFNNEQLYRTCEEYLQKDFTEYGAVALLILGPIRLSLPGPGSKIKVFDDSVIMNNFEVERNPTLAEKPKIYITEVDYFAFDVLDYPRHVDVIGFQTAGLAKTAVSLNKKQILAEALDKPLSMLCRNLAAMGDNATFNQIIERTMDDSHKSFAKLNPMPIYLKTPFGLSCSLTKELYLARVEET